MGITGLKGDEEPPTLSITGAVNTMKRVKKRLHRVDNFVVFYRFELSLQETFCWVSLGAPKMNSLNQKPSQALHSS